MEFREEPCHVGRFVVKWHDDRVVSRRRSDLWQRLGGPEIGATLYLQWYQNALVQGSGQGGGGKQEKRGVKRAGSGTEFARIFILGRSDARVLPVAVPFRGGAALVANKSSRARSPFDNLAQVLAAPREHPSPAGQ